VCGVQVIYCPDLYALRDLWAICDRVNGALRSVLLPPAQDYSESPVMVEYGLRRAATSVSISGPEYLQYKERLISQLQQQNSLGVA
jgi:hypothetical protein